MTQITRDHSEAQDLVDRGVLDLEEARTWPRRNVVTRALGATDEAELEIVDGPSVAGDRFLLCSDGLTGMSPTTRSPRACAATPRKRRATT